MKRKKNAGPPPQDLQAFLEEAYTVERQRVILARNLLATLRGRELAAGQAKSIPFSANTRMSGLDFGPRSIRKGAVDAVKKHVQAQGGAVPAELDAISNGLKAMAMEFKVGIVLLSQLNRKADERSGPPVMADLRDSGAIEAAADLIGMLYRDVVRNPTGDNTRHAQLEIVAQRNGPAGTVHLHFVGEHQQFTDWPRNAPLPMRRASKSYSGGGLE